MQNHIKDVLPELDVPVSVGNRSVWDIGENEVDGRLSVSREEEINRKWGRIEHYLQSGTIIEGTLSAVEPDKENLELRIVTRAQGFRVIIPSEEYFHPETFYRNDFYEASPMEQFNRRMQMARARLGSRVSFIIIAAEAGSSPNDSAIIGSRVKAMEIKRDLYFFGSKIPEERKITTGTIVEARILSSGREKCVVECFGVETVITAGHLSAKQYVRDCREIVSPGDVLQTIVNSLTVDATSRTVSLVLSGRIRDSELFESAARVNLGTYAQGQIVSFNESKNMYTAVTDDGWLAAIPRDRIVGREALFMGDWVSLCVKYKSNKGYNICTAQRIHRRSD